MTATKTARGALAALMEGNRRFVANVRGTEAILSQVRRAELAVSQKPFAILLGCSDARVPAEIVFDQGFGDLFVIRVAGNIVAPSQVGSVEFAAERLGIRLVVVLGHMQCGAVGATVASVLEGAPPASRDLMSIIDRIRPAVLPLVQSSATRDKDALVRAAVRANVRASASHLRHGSALLESLIAKEGLDVVGAEYDVVTGAVDFFDSE
jgi:carbonic anhydrase